MATLPDFDFDNIIPRPIHKRIITTTTTKTTTTTTTTTTTIKRATRLPVNEFCPSCKKDTIVPTNFESQTQCYQCHYRPSIDCPSCFQDNTLEIAYKLGPLRCWKCEWHESADNFLQPRFGDAMTFTEAETEPELQHYDNEIEYNSIQKQSKKHKHYHMQTEKLLHTKEENRQYQIEMQFKQYITRFFEMIIRDQIAFRMQINTNVHCQACLKYLHAYQKVLKQLAEEGKEKTEQLQPEILKLQQAKVQLQRNYADYYNYKESDFLEDTKKFESQVKEFKEQIDIFTTENDKELQRFQTWFDYRNDIEQLERS
jgi:hypothetical protein